MNKTLIPAVLGSFIAAGIIGIPLLRSAEPGEPPRQRTVTPRGPVAPPATRVLPRPTHKSALWVPARPNGLLTEALPPIREDIRDAALLSVDPAAITQLEAGDWITLHIPQLQHEIDVLIDRVSLSRFGTRSLHGHIDGERLLGFVLTASPRAIYATIGTADGVYNAFGDARHLWIVAARELNRHVRREVPDYRGAMPPSRPVLAALNGATNRATPSGSEGRQAQGATGHENEHLSPLSPSRETSLD